MLLKGLWSTGLGESTVLFRFSTEFKDLYPHIKSATKTHSKNPNSLFKDAPNIKVTLGHTSYVGNISAHGKVLPIVRYQGYAD